jgi:hypothetical protein
MLQVFDLHFTNIRHGHAKTAHGYETHKLCVAMLLELQRVIKTRSVSVSDVFDATLRENITRTGEFLS